MLALLFLAAYSASAPIEVVPEVDLKRYAGKWYEVARLPNRFQRNCAGNVTASYDLRPDGKITVLNACRERDGGIKTAKGTARPAHRRGPNSKLKVTFFWPFSGDYWILHLDPGYRWAVVGDPSRKYLWFLSRTPFLDSATFEELESRVRGQGFDTTRLVRTLQDQAGW